jgi:hypothetical protein
MFEIAVEKFLQRTFLYHWQGDFCNNVDVIELWIGAMVVGAPKETFEFGQASRQLKKNTIW